MTFLREIKSFFTSDRILVLGDSHAAVFYHWLFDLNFPRFTFTVLSIGGATVSGLENPNSKTQAGPIFERAIRKYPSRVYILLLGEVDTGFVIWYRAQKYHASVDEMLRMAVEKYANLIRRLVSQGKVVVISAPLPTIPDQNPCGEVANLRREIKATQQERTQLTLTFNQSLSQICTSLGAYFVNLDPFSLDENGRIRKELLNPNPCDHHYNFSAYARLLVKALKPLLLE